MKHPDKLSKSIILFFTLAVFTSCIWAQDWEGKVSLHRETNKQKLHVNEAERILKKKNALFNLDVDIQLGLGIANTNVDLNKAIDSVGGEQGTDLENTKTKIGPTIGAIVNVDFLGFGFTTGLQYSSKGFETAGGTKTGMNYLNIPLLFYFGFEADKIRIDGNIGPYFGLLLSQDKTTYFAVKNFDLGLTGNISGAYMFNKYIGALLGCKYEYGGLNNLQSNEYIKKTTSSTFFIYSGLKFEL